LDTRSISATVKPHWLIFDHSNLRGSGLRAVMSGLGWNLFCSGRLREGPESAHQRLLEYAGAPSRLSRSTTLPGSS